MNAKNFILVTLAISGVALFLVLQNFPKDTSSKYPRVPVIEKVASRGLAPDFTLVDLDGNIFQLAGSKGNVLVLMFWTSW